MEMATDCWSWAKVDYEGTNYLNIIGIYRMILDYEQFVLFYDEILPNYPNRYIGPDKYCLIESKIQATFTNKSNSVKRSSATTIKYLSETASTLIIQLVKKAFPAISDKIARRNLQFLDLSGFFKITKSNWSPEKNHFRSEFSTILSSNNCKSNDELIPKGLIIKLPNTHLEHDDINGIFTHKFAFRYETLDDQKSSIFFDELQILRALDDSGIRYRVIEPTMIFSDGTFNRISDEDKDIDDEKDETEDESSSPPSNTGKLKPKDTPPKRTDLIIIAAFKERLIDRNAEPLSNQSHLFRVIENKNPGIKCLEVKNLEKKLALANKALEEAKYKALEKARLTIDKTNDSSE